MREALERQRRYLVPGIGVYYKQPLTLVSGQGCHVQDDQGKSYLDFFGGILTVSVGHCHPVVTQAITQQAATLVHTSTLYLSEPMIDLAEYLAKITPGALAQSFFTTSGTEANETALVMAQLATGRNEVVALRHSYSGRSQVTMGLTGQGAWKLGGSGMGLPIRHTHNPYCYRCPFGKTPDRCGLECARDMDDFIKTSTSGLLAAFIAEPIQGVGGFITPPPAFFQEAVGIARKYGALFIDDEVQTGFGRTGKPFGINHYGVEPDIMTFAKGMANGMPVGATIATPDVARHYQGPTISTFGGNPVVMQAALATLQVMEQEQLTERAATLGRILRSGLEQLADEYPVMGDVRGMGLMQGIEVVEKDKAPAAELAEEILELAKDRGLLLGLGGLYHNVLRIAPPLTVSDEEVNEALTVLRDVMSALYQAHPGLVAVESTRIVYQ